MFEQLILAIDDSAASEVATSFASALAARSGASVHVFHVNEQLVGGRGMPLRTREEATALLTDAMSLLRDAGVRASGSSVVASYRHVPRCIAEVARDQGADAIVLGSRRRRHLGRLFSTRVRERTIRLTTLPVLTAPSPLAVSSRDLADVDAVLRSYLEGAQLPLPS